MMIDFSGSAEDGRSAPALKEPVVTRESICSITPAYRAPELGQTKVKQVDSRVDIYSCGVMFAKLLETLVTNWKREQRT